MAPNDKSLCRDVLVVNELGLHARAAAKLAKTAQTADKGVWLEHEGERVDAKQVIDLLTLGAARGAQVRICVDTPRDMEILHRIVGLFASGFGE